MESKHPKGLYVLFFTEMWERFSFYLLLGILYQYLTDDQKGGLGWTGAQGAKLVGSYIALVYFTPFLGGLLADRVFGARKTIIAGGILMMIGHLVLAIPNQFGLYAGLLFLILGNGAFKPNISTLVGNLYPPGSPLKDAGFNIFYMGINIGAFVCNFIAAIVRNYFDKHPELGIQGWHAAFATAGVGMFIGLIIFGLNYRRFAAVDPDPRLSRERGESLRPLWVQCLGPAAVAAAIAWLLDDWLVKDAPGDPRAFLGGPTAAFLGACIPVIIFYVNVWRGLSDRRERGRTAALLAIFGVVIVFWMIFHLNTTALTEWAVRDTDRRPNAVVQPVIDAMPEFAENAPPEYYGNAGADTPRPAEATFEVVSEAEYKAKTKANELWRKEEAPGEDPRFYVYVTPKILEDVYAKADPETPRLPEGRHLRLVNPELFQSINPFFVILFTPLLVAFWNFLRLRGKEPSTPAKIGFGLLLTACGPLVMLLATLSSNDGEVKATAWWLFGTYAVTTLGELCLSPMGLSLVSKMAPASIRAFMMGGWFVSTSFGNKLSGIFGEVYNKWDHVTFWIVLMVSGAVFAGIILFGLLPWLRRELVVDHVPADDAATIADLSVDQPPDDPLRRHEDRR